jgi:hypothetical protein
MAVGEGDGRHKLLQKKMEEWEQWAREEEERTRREEEEDAKLRERAGEIAMGSVMLGVLGGTCSRRGAWRKSRSRWRRQQR